MTAIRTRAVTLSDHELFIAETGDPMTMPTVLFLHGSGPGVTALSNWEQAIGDLGDQYYCIAPDVLGFGDSTHPDPAPQGVTDFTQARVQSLIELIDTIGADRVHLVGNSMGCVFALEIATRIPDRIGKIILMGSGNVPDQPKMPGMGKLSSFYADPTVDAMAEMMSLFVFDPQQWGDRLSQIARGRLDLALREDVRRSHLATFAPCERKLFTPEYLAAIDKSVLVVHGADDRIVSPDASRYISEHLPHAHLFLIGRCGHWSQIEYPALFANLVSGFIEGPLDVAH